MGMRDYVRKIRLGPHKEFKLCEGKLDTGEIHMGNNEVILVICPFRKMLTVLLSACHLNPEISMSFSPDLVLNPFFNTFLLQSLSSFTSDKA